MDNGYISFRRAKVGGFNKKDVINYIEKMRNDFYDYKKAVEATVDSLNDKIRELEVLNDNSKTDISKPSDSGTEVRSCDPISDINASAVRLRMVADELCRNLTDFMCTVIGEAVTETEECKDEENIEESAEDCCDEPTSFDKVSEILARSSNFSFLSDEKDEKLKEEKPVAADGCTVLDKLTSSAFFN